MITEKICNLDLSKENRMFYGTELILLEEYLELGSLYRLHGHIDLVLDTSRRLVFLKPDDCLIYLGNSNKNLKRIEHIDLYNDYYQFLFGSKILIVGVGHSSAIRRLLNNIEKIS